MILADLEIAGEPRKVLMQAPKNGFFYVLDRTTGELLSAEAYVPVTWATTSTWKPGDRSKIRKHTTPTKPGRFSLRRTAVTTGTR